MTRTRKDIEKEIIRQCGEDGFLVLLIAKATFDTTKFKELVSSLEEYDIILGDSTTIDRYVAGCLLHLETMLGNAVFEHEDLGLPIAEKTAAAHAEISDLVHRILMPPSTGGS